MVAAGSVRKVSEEIAERNPDLECVESELTHAYGRF